MRILVAEDDPVSLRILEALCASWGYRVIVARDGLEAARILEDEDAPPLALLDWMMPGMDGLEVIRRARRKHTTRPVYILLVTARESREDLIRGLLARADDYITKPFDQRELRARIQVGVRVAELQIALAARVKELEEALGRVKRLQGLLPICSYCKRIRDDRNYWQQVEGYIQEHSEAEFTHGICPQCYETIVKREFEQRSALPVGEI
ncbi:MAG: response regulator [Terriglobia bacterium]